MILRKYFILIFIGLSYFGFSQNAGTSTRAHQSSIKGNGGANYAIDGNVQLYSTSTTNNSSNAWWEVDLEGMYTIQGVNILSPAPLTNVYVIVSQQAIFSASQSSDDYQTNGLFIDGLIDRGATVFTLDGVSSNDLYIPFSDEVGQFVTVVSSVWGDLGITEVEVIKTTTGTVGPYGSGGYYHNNSEDCSDGIDNDNDGFVDCDDYSCKVKNVNIWYTEPSCPICIDGEICIKAFPASKVSLDGGVTWQSFTDGQCFTVGDGVYDIILESPGGCKSTSETVTFSSNTGTDRTPCLNGGFENGNFENWKGGLMTQGTNYTSAGPHIFNNEDFAINTRHSIINSDGFVDPIVGNLILPGQGQYFAKLGNITTLMGGNQSGPHHLEKLSYCLEVEDADFAFMYAQVMQDPNHDPEELPFFFYNITDTDGIELASGLITSDDEYLINFGGIIRYRGWTCAHIDLKSFLGQEVCINFINSDCNQGGHGGYTYIDEVCASPADFIPFVDINSCADKICGDQLFSLDVPAGFYNEFAWTIAQIDQNGNKFGVKQFDKDIGYVAHIEDLKLFYESNSNFTFQCNSQIEVTLEVFNGCGSNSETVLFDYDCVTYNIDYCDPIIICGDDMDIQIIGENDCVGCTYEWQPASRLIDATVKFPTVNSENYWDSYFKTYTVKVTTPEGCIFKDTVRFDDNGAFTLDMEPLDLGYCGFNIAGSVVLTAANVSIANDKIIVTATNLINGTVETLTVSGSGFNRSFGNSYDRESTKHILIQVELNFDDMDCASAATCSQSHMFDEVPWTTYHAYWKAAFPNILTPNQPQNNQMKVYFKSLAEDDPQPDCDIMSTTASSIYYYKMDVFHYWGEHIFSKDTMLSIYDTQGITGNEIFWDGTFEGNQIDNGNYSVMITTKSCFPGEYECYNCGGSEDWQYCTGVNSDAAQQGTPGGTDQDNPDIFSFLVYVDNG